MQKVKWVSLILPLIGSQLMAAQFDPPDLNFELELHKQYLKHSGQGVMQAPLSGSKVESYQIQSGESLWNLSQMLYGDGHFWPRVWAQNQSITNPHLIRKGHTLQFLMGSEDETPSFRISEGDDAGVELAAANQNQSLIEIPPPEIPPRPVSPVPKSFPEWQQVFKPGKDVIGLDDRALGRDREEIPDRIFLTSYVQEGPLDSVGSFLETDSESGLPMANQYIFVKVKKGVGSPGLKMLLARDAGPLIKLNQRAEFDKKRINKINIGGEIQLSEQVVAEFKKAKDQGDYDVFRALITRATNLSTWEYGIIPGELAVVDLSDKGPSGVVSAQIIGSEKHEASALFGPGEIVFLNKGSSSGVEVGQILEIYEDRKIRKDTPVQFSPASSGKIKVVQVNSNLSTAVLLKARSGIQQGDHVQEVSSRSVESEALDEIGKGGPSSADDDIMFEDEADESNVEGDLDSEDF